MLKNWMRAGLEDFDGDNVDVAQLENPQESVEAQLVEVQGQDAELAQLANDGQELAADTETLENVADAVQDAAASGGMDETAARVVDVAVEALTSKYGIRRVRVGAESFSTPANRVRSTKAACESIGSALKDMWDTFVKWLRGIANSLKGFVLKYYNAGKSMRKRAEKLEARLDKGLGKVDKKKIGGGWLKDLMLNGKVEVDQVIELAGKVSKDTGAIADKIVATLNTAKKTLSASTTPAGGTAVTINFGKKATKNLGQGLTGATEIHTQALPGDQYLQTYKDSKGIAHGRLIAGGEDQPKDIETPTEAKMSEALQAVFGVADALEERLKEFKDLDEQYKELADAAEEAKKDIGDLSDEDKANPTARAAARTKYNTAKAAAATALAEQRALTNSLKSAGNGLLGFVAAGISAYGKAD